MSLSLAVLDVSHHDVPDHLAPVQGDDRAGPRRLFMKKVLLAAQDDGVLALVAKATQGAAFVDWSFADWRAVAAELALPFGAYHFGTAAPVAAQLALFLATVGITACAEPGRLGFLALDAEVNGADTMAPDQVAEWATLFAQAVGEPGWTYGFADDLCTRIAPALLAGGRRAPADLARTKLWLSEVCGAGPRKWPDLIWPTWSLWQRVTSDAVAWDVPAARATLPGIGRCDRSDWPGTAETLRTAFAPR